MTNETFFSQIEFIRAVANCSQGEKRVFPIRVLGSGPDRYMYGIEELDRYGRRSVSLAPFGLYASPGWEGELECATLRGIVRRLTGVRTLSFNWTIRFDHTALAEGLTSLGFRSTEHRTHILPLDSDYEKVFAGFTATIRNQIRRSHREGVSVKEVSDHASVRDYHAIYDALSEMQRRGFVYPLALFHELVAIPGAVRLLVAIWQGRIIGGGIFVHDGCSDRYWHGAADRAYANLFPNCAILDYAIRESCTRGSSFLNFGGSVGKASLEQFKSFWGAKLEKYWTFEWANPLWSFASSLRKKVRHARFVRPQTANNEGSDWQFTRTARTAALGHLRAL
jgi:hypothetical protein